MKKPPAKPKTKFIDFSFSKLVQKHARSIINSLPKNERTQDAALALSAQVSACLVAIIALELRSDAAESTQRPRNESFTN